MFDLIHSARETSSEAIPDPFNQCSMANVLNLGSITVARQNIMGKDDQYLANLSFMATNAVLKASR